MNNVLRVAMLAIAVCLFGCVSAPRSTLSPTEIAEILQIRAWRIPQPAKGTERSLDVVTKENPPEGRTRQDLEEVFRTTNASPLEDRSRYT